MRKNIYKLHIVEDTDQGESGIGIGGIGIGNPAGQGIGLRRPGSLYIPESLFDEQMMPVGAELPGRVVATPTFSPVAGTYDGTQNITISCATSGASIYYTDDGSTPDNTDNLYSTTVAVSSATTLKAIGIKDSYVDSNVGTASYVFLTGIIDDPVIDPENIPDPQDLVIWVRQGLDNDWELWTGPVKSLGYSANYLYGNPGPFDYDDVKTALEELVDGDMLLIYPRFDGDDEVVPYVHTDGVGWGMFLHKDVILRGMGVDVDDVEIQTTTTSVLTLGVDLNGSNIILENFHMQMDRVVSGAAMNFQSRGTFWNDDNGTIYITPDSRYDINKLHISSPNLESGTILFADTGVFYGNITLSNCEINRNPAAGGYALKYSGLNDNHGLVYFWEIEYTESVNCYSCTHYPFVHDYRESPTAEYGTAYGDWLVKFEA